MQQLLQMDKGQRELLVSIWLPNDEKDVAILEPVYRQYKGTKYRVAVFRSGREDLLNNTAKLLKINKQ